MKWRTPPQIARELFVGPPKVRGWIESGELKAVNTSTRATGRPRWKVSAEELEAFLLRRQARPEVSAPRKRRELETVIEFF